MNKSDMLYLDEYSWKTTEGDDPKKVYHDAKMFSRNEGYEVLYLINSLRAKDGSSLPLKSEKIIEWMIHDHLPSEIRSHKNVRTWICDNFPELKLSYPH
ncbi:hypothetical protein [Zymobacter sp. IVIA_5232.4 C2]|uniref:hypothetical protein n=1 Tax=Zymobacter sp. IVIA_5232.4 C2 TaxID=3394855 RepID=UPI0039C051F8